MWLWDCHGLQWQHWWLMPDGQIRGMAGKCLTANGSAAGSPVVLTTCDPFRSDQRWTPSYEILLLGLAR